MIHASTLGILFSLHHSHRITIGCYEPPFRTSDHILPRFTSNLLVVFLIETKNMHEAEIVSQGCRCPVCRFQDRFNSQCTASCHRVQKMHTRLPAGSLNDSSCQCFLHRRRGGSGSVVSSRERFTRCIDKNPGDIFRPIEKNNTFIQVSATVGPYICFNTGPVCDRIFYNKVCILIVFNGGVLHTRSRAEIAVRGYPLFTWQGFQPESQFIRAGNRTLCNKIVNPVCSPKPVVQPDTIFQRCS